jgi:hypothetical protein
MAFRHGKYAVVTLNSVDLSTFSDSAELTIDIDTADTTMFGSTWKSSIVGLAGAKGSLSGAYDPTATTGPSSAIWAVITGGVPVTLVYKPGGTASGQRTNTASAIVTSFQESSPVGDKVEWKCDLEITGAVTPTTQ